MAKIIVLDEWEVAAVVRALGNYASYASNAAERAAGDALVKELLANDDPVELRRIRSAVNGKLGKRKITPEQQAKMQAARQKDR